MDKNGKDSVLGSPLSDHGWMRWENGLIIKVIKGNLRKTGSHPTPKDMGTMNLGMPRVALAAGYRSRVRRCCAERLIGCGLR